ncbi:hypothetical protein PIB30_103605, partial [Stylosanthes scabra]|nr:hypothetical protein [Stylosanthes scabra]
MWRERRTDIRRPTTHGPGVSVNGVPGLEMKLVQQTLNQLQQEGATQLKIKLAMKDLGIK